jgi:hypothetical protein
MFSYKKVGGLHFVRVWRLGFSFYWASTSVAKKPQPIAAQMEIRYN